MSRKKFNNSKKSLDDPIILRILTAFEYTKLTQLASFYGISEQNLNGYIKRGTLLKLVTPELLKRKVYIEWIETGNGQMLSSNHNNVITYRHPDHQKALEMLEDIFRSNDETKRDIVRKCMEEIEREDQIAAIKKDVEEIKNLLIWRKPPDENMNGGSGL